MNSRCSLAVLLSLLLCAPAHAGWSERSRISGIQLDPDGDALITLSDMSANPAGCEVHSVYRLSADSRSFRRTYLLILASYLAQHEVRLALAGGRCEDAAPSIESIEMPY